MKIVMIGQKGFPALYGGIERHVEDLSKELAKQGHQILVYARKWYSESTVHYPGIRVVKLPSIHTKHLDAISHTLFATIHALFQKPDVIHYHGVGPALFSWIPRLVLPRTKVIATFHCIDRYHQKWGWLARLMLRLGEIAACVFPHKTIAVSKTIQNYCVNEYQQTTTFIPNGVQFPPAAAGNNLLQRWNLQPGKYILMATRLVRHKGAHYLIDAWQFVKEQYPQLVNDYKLVIVGDSTFTDEYVEELHRMAEGDSSVVFTGWLFGEPLEQLYANTRLYVHPSENEGLPITVLQAMACGRPVLVSDIPEHQEVIVDPRFWFANTSVASLADKLVELLKLPELLISAGEDNRAKVKTTYAWRALGEKTRELYEQPLPKAQKQKTSSELEIAKT